MSFFDSRLYRVMDMLTNFLLLNLLWVLACVPLITIFPATAALFAVVRGWIRGTEQGFFMSFFRYMRENFVQSLAVGLVWLALGLVLVVDFLFVREVTSWGRIPLFALFFVVTAVYLATAVYLFPVMVHFHTGWIQIIKNSFFITFSSPGVTLICLLIVTLACLVCYIFPISFLAIGSTTAYFIYHFCHKVFQRIEPDIVEKAESDER